MQQYYLTQIITRDQLIHQGFFYQPKKPTRKAILYVHGLTSHFYSGLTLLETFAETCETHGFGFAAFNNRGHDIVTGIKKIDKRKSDGYTHVNGGAAYEDFTKCIFDIEAGIDFLVEQGFPEVILIGLSTGANKACFYGGKRKHPNLKSIILASPVSDRLVPVIDQKKIQGVLVRMHELVNAGKGDGLLTDDHDFPVTPKRFISLFQPNTQEDVFDYGDMKPKLTYFSRIKVPLLVLFGSSDESIDRPAKEVMSVFDRCQKSVNYKSVIIPNASHGYNGQEKEVVNIICDWIKTI